MRKRIVITGIGVLAANAIGKENFWQALAKGESGIKPVSLFDTSQLSVQRAGEITDFDAKRFLGEKGLRTLDRATKLVSSAAMLALEDCGLKVSEENTERIGISIGTTLGSVHSISEFDKEGLRSGPRAVNPAIFPNTVINSPASHAAIFTKIKGFNATISTGFTASLDAIKYALDFINLGRVEAVFAGGVEELCLHTYLGFYKLGFLAGIKDGTEEISCPFDKRRSGIVFGEGAAVLALEELNFALKRNADIYAEVFGFGTAFDAYRINKYNPRGEGLRRAMRAALEDAHCGTSDIDYISSAANSTLEADCIETEAIKGVFGDCAKHIPVSSIKSMLGECFSASGALGVVSAVGALREKIIPPTINYQEKDEACDLDYVPNKARKSDIDKVMINAFGPSGCNSSLVIGRFNPGEKT